MACARRSTAPSVRVIGEKKIGRAPRNQPSLLSRSARPLSASPRFNKSRRLSKWPGPRRSRPCMDPLGSVRYRRENTARTTSERFHLALHRETKEIQGYALVAGRNRPGLRKSSEADSLAAAQPQHPPARPEPDQKASMIWSSRDVSFEKIKQFSLCIRGVCSQHRDSSRHLFWAGNGRMVRCD